MIGKHRRQGDVLIIETNEIKGKKIRKRKDKKTILALGEVTGHHHRFGHPEVQHFLHDDRGGIDMFEAPEDAMLVHEEHGAFKAPSKKFFQGHQVEYTPKEIRRVAD